MDVLFVIFGILGIILFVVSVLISITEGEFVLSGFGVVVILGLLAFGSITLYTNSNTGEEYTKFETTSINNTYMRIAQKTCTKYTLGFDICNTVDEKFMKKESLIKE